MTSRHTHLTPDLPPTVEVPDLPGAQHPHDPRTDHGGEREPRREEPPDGSPGRRAPAD
ncbi:hypothetical protein [Streptomyces syringium]|uniref:hypothetical protein n=1 Tax=Streptomyces syringium TaxID=76729 RepID=UPI0033C17A7A